MHRAATAHLGRQDPVLHGVIRRIGPCTLRPKRDRFGMLVRSIVSQQISTAAARTIYHRLQQAAGGISPAAIAALDVAQLRAAGLSPQKASYIGDLAHKVAAGTVRLARMGRLGDEQVIAELTQVRGIGRWTAQMFLIFALGRPDVFPTDDLGVQTALHKLYGNGDVRLSRDAMTEIGLRWSPYASIGSWYCWRYLEFDRTPTPLA